MPATEAQIAELLDALKGLLRRIEPLRKRVAEIEAGLTATQREYEQKLSRANKEADRLEGLKLSLVARLRGEQAQDSVKVSLPPRPVAPPQIIDANRESALSPPPAPPESLAAKGKRVLLDHVFYFSDSNQTDDIERLNAILDDERRDVGDLLELLTWGDIWTVRANWETLDEQLQRLEGWRRALEERAVYWEREVQRLMNDQRYDLWQSKVKYSPEKWLAFLNQMLQRQETENQRLALEVKELERRLRAQSSSAGVNHG